MPPQPASEAPARCARLASQRQPAARGWSYLDLETFKLFFKPHKRLRVSPRRPTDLRRRRERCICAREPPPRVPAAAAAAVAASLPRPLSPPPLSLRGVEEFGLSLGRIFQVFGRRTPPWRTFHRLDHASALGVSQVLRVLPGCTSPPGSPAHAACRHQPHASVPLTEPAEPTRALPMGTVPRPSKP